MENTTPLARAAVGVVLALALLPAAQARANSPRIVDGELSFGHPPVGALLAASESLPGRIDGICTGTLIGCRTFLTAAHCLCPPGALGSESCTRRGLTNPASLLVFLPHGGLFDVESVAIHPSYEFTRGGDVGVVRLAVPATGIAPAAINLARRPPDGSAATIVGFGSAGGGPPAFRLPDFGLKRDGHIVTGPCSENIDGATHVCWTFVGDGASTCIGDSGGPLFADLGEGMAVTGTVSGDESPNCSAPDPVFTTDVFVHRDWILEQLGDDTPPCGDLPLVGDPRVEVAGFSGEVDGASPVLLFSFDVPALTTELRVTLNGEQGKNEGPLRLTNDFDLYLRRGAPPTDDEYDCVDDSDGTFGACVIELPQAGTWYALVARIEGAGAVQVTATSFESGLAGDANCDDRIGSADLVAMTILIGSGDRDPCGRADIDGDGVVDATDLALLEALLFDP